MTANEILERMDSIVFLNKIKKACVAAMWLGVLVEVIFCRGGIVVSENVVSSKYNFKNLSYNSSLNFNCFKILLKDLLST